MTPSKIIAFAATVAAASLTAAAALAQSAPPPPSAPAWTPPPAGSFGGSSEQYNQFQRVVWHQHMTDMAENRPTASQWARAREAAAMINNGQCDAAHKMALGAKDERLAGRIVEVCLNPKS